VDGDLKRHLRNARHYGWRYASDAGAGFNWASIIAAAFFGVLTSCALGLDFPESNKRFARLA
jgi:hypothetical protein